MPDFIDIGHKCTSESDNSNSTVRPTFRRGCFDLSQPPFPYQEQFQTNSNRQEAAFQPIYWDEDFVKIMFSDSDKEDELNDEYQHF
jgi:hypothetical protein